MTTDLTPEALDRLDTRARAATPGPWEHGRDYLLTLPVWRLGSTTANDDVCALGRSWTNSKANADYIAAADPATILALIAEVRRLQRWKTEALPVLDGLQELGKALSIPLGKRITGPDAVQAAERLNAEVRSLREDLAETKHQLDVDRKHAALVDGGACDVCSHLEIEQMAQHGIELLEENDDLLAKIKRVRETAERIDERSASAILRALDGGAS